MVLYGTFSRAQWQPIETDLAAVGIDLDATKLPSWSDRPWWLSGDYILRDGIQNIAHHYGLLLRLNCKPPTALQRAEALQATVDGLTTTLALIEHTDLADDHTWRNNIAQFRARLGRKYDLQDAITQEIADLKVRTAALKAKGGGSTENASTVRNDYWREQARLWLALKPNVSRRDRRAHLRRYLVHCSASLFDVMTAPELESKIAAFVGHLFTSKRSPK
jgi:hypothetical protein